MMEKKIIKRDIRLEEEMRIVWAASAVMVIDRVLWWWWWWCTYFDWGFEL